MIKGIGIDVVDVKRIERLSEKLDERFVKRIFTDEEIKYCNGRKANKFQHFAGRFASKEAFLKAIGVGLFKGYKLKDIEIRNEKSGQPYIVRNEKIDEVLNKLNATNIYITITHIKEVSVATVIIE